MKLKNSILCYLILTAICLSTTSLSAQVKVTNEKEKNKLKTHYRSDQGLFLGVETRWINVQNESYFNQDNRVYIATLWNNSCSECDEVIREFETLRIKYPNLSFCVINVPSKPAEADFENIREAVARKKIDLAVAVPKSLDKFKTIDVTQFPNTVIIGLNGERIQQISGTNIEQQLPKDFDVYLKALIENKDLTTKSPLKGVVPERFYNPKGILSFPTAIAADEEEGIVYVLNSGTNQIFGFTFSGILKSIIGSGKVGHENGTFGKCTFNDPVGLAFDNTTGTLFISEAGNHCIRAANIASNEVKTVLGSGQEAIGMEPRVNGISGRLTSPGEIEMMGNKLLICMKGDHSIWQFDPRSKEAIRFIGSGKSGDADGKLKKVQLDNPSAIAVGDRGEVFIFEENSGKLKKFHKKSVETIFSREKSDSAYFQFPRGLVSNHSGGVHILDSYENQMFEISQDGEKTLAIGTGVSGWLDGGKAKASMNEPWDIVEFNGLVYITDTNNHLIRVYDKKSAELNTLDIHNTKILMDRLKSIEDRSSSTFLEEVKLSKEENLIELEYVFEEPYELIVGAEHRIYLMDQEFDDLMDYDLDAGTITILSEGNEKNVGVTLELLILYRHIEKPEARYYRSSRVMIPYVIAKEGEEVENASRITFNPLDFKLK